MIDSLRAIASEPSARTTEPAAHEARVTAIVPIKFHVERYVHEAFASLCGQTCEAWRAIAVVEPEDLPRFRAMLAPELRDPRITLVANRGAKLAGAINTGIWLATTEFVAILLADDAWSGDAVEVLNRNIESHPDIDFFHSARRAIDDEGGPCGTVMLPQREVVASKFVWGTRARHLLCFRRSLAIAVGGVDESLMSVGPDDYDFPWTMAEHGARFHAIDDCLYIYRDHRAAYRLTTHLPLSVHTRALVRTLRKHRVGWWLIFKRVRSARRGYLKQCLYRNALHKWLVERFGFPPRRVWREYR